jgi:hypothetical protein
VRRVVNAVVPALGYDDRLAREVLDGEGDAIAAIASFERQEPASLTAAAQLLSGHGTLTTEAFDRVACAYDIYRHVRNMPCD